MESSIKYVPQDDNMTEVVAELSGPGAWRKRPARVARSAAHFGPRGPVPPEGTPYEGGTFRLKLVLGSQYPTVPPRGAWFAPPRPCALTRIPAPGFFLTKIFHPNVSEAGDICVNALKRDWKPDLTLGHILKVIWCLLIVPFPESALNDEAGKLFMESYDEYADHARLMTQIHATAQATDGAAADAAEAGDAAAASGTAAPAAAAEAGAKAGRKGKKGKKKTLKRL